MAVLSRAKRGIKRLTLQAQCQRRGVYFVLSTATIVSGFARTTVATPHIDSLGRTLAVRLSPWSEGSCVQNSKLAE